MKVQKPIFIIGVGRSGSTIFHRILSDHPKLSWLSTLCDKHPENLNKNRYLMKALDYPLVGGYLQSKVGRRECYEFWEYHCKGFRRSCRDLLAGDVTLKIEEQIQNILSQTLTKRRDRLLIKITGWPRMGFLKAIFSDAKFIHVLRDGRAVVNSMINIDFWRGWEGPQNWRWGELSRSQREVWEKHNKSFFALAAIQWKILMDAVEKAKIDVDENDFFEVKYEDLSSNTMNVFRKVVKFCELEWSSRFEKSVKRYEVKNQNYKWQNEFTQEQKSIVEDVLLEYLKKYDYL